MCVARRDHYLIDGYNVIHAWPELKRLCGDLAAARDALTHLLTEYGAFEKYEITLVFDAMFTEDEERVERVGRHTRIIYTGAGETADSRIERLAYEEAHRGRTVYVVTSDGAVESVILGAGACRIPSLEFRKQVLRVKRELKRDYLGIVRLPEARYVVSDRLDRDTAAKLDALRKQTSED